jgi:hypothetical protein
LQVIDWRDREADPAALQAVAAAECAKGFDLLQAPLTRITLVRTAEDAWLIWTSHHILMDGWSTSRLLGEVFQATPGRAAGAPGRYRDYIDWLQRQSAEADEQFWRARLADLDGPTLLAGTLAPQPAPGESGHGALYLNWDAAATAPQGPGPALAGDRTADPGHLAAAVAALQRAVERVLRRRGGGPPGRAGGADEMLGLFINTLPIAQTLDPQLSVGEWLTQLGYNLEARDHEHASLADVQRWSGQGGQALFDSIVVFENYPIDERLADAGDDQLRFGEVRAAT